METFRSLYYVLQDNLESTFYTLILVDFDLPSLFELALPFKGTGAMELKLTRAAVSLAGLMMSAEDHFMRMAFDQLPEFHRLLAQTCTRGVEEAKKIEGSVDLEREAGEEAEKID